jgi:hypothetical protein
MCTRLLQSHATRVHFVSCFPGWTTMQVSTPLCAAVHFYIMDKKKIRKQAHFKKRA